jgi:hypothetical protein
MKFFVQWKTRGQAEGPVKVRLELRGAAAGGPSRQLVIEKTLKPGGWFSHWATLDLAGDEYTRLGEVTAWRATLWEGNQLLSEQKSFLW